MQKKNKENLIGGIFSYSKLNGKILEELEFRKQIKAFKRKMKEEIPRIKEEEYLEKKKALYEKGITEEEIAMLLGPRKEKIKKALGITDEDIKILLENIEEKDKKTKISFKRRNNATKFKKVTTKNIEKVNSNIYDNIIQPIKEKCTEIIEYIKDTKKEINHINNNKEIDKNEKIANIYYTIRLDIVSSRKLKAVKEQYKKIKQLIKQSKMGELKEKIDEKYEKIMEYIKETKKGIDDINNNKDIDKKLKLENVWYTIKSDIFGNGHVRKIKRKEKQEDKKYKRTKTLNKLNSNIKYATGIDVKQKLNVGKEQYAKMKKLIERSKEINLEEMIVKKFKNSKCLKVAKEQHIKIKEFTGKSFKAVKEQSVKIKKLIEESKKINLEEMIVRKCKSIKTLKSLKSQYTKMKGLIEQSKNGNLKAKISEKYKNNKRKIAGFAIGGLTSIVLLGGIAVGVNNHIERNQQAINANTSRIESNIVLGNINVNNSSIINYENKKEENKVQDSVMLDFNSAIIDALDISVGSRFITEEGQINTQSDGQGTIGNYKNTGDTEFHINKISVVNDDGRVIESFIDGESLKDIKQKYPDKRISLHVADDRGDVGWDTIEQIINKKLYELKEDLSQKDMQDLIEAKKSGKISSNLVQKIQQIKNRQINNSYDNER